jgi:hypothetical protein
MDKSSRDSSASELVSKAARRFPPSTAAEVQVDSESISRYNKVENKVKLQSLLDACLIYTGQSSGKQYMWKKAGSIVEVDVEDSIVLLAKRIGTQLCCGNSSDTNKIFSIVN